MKIFIVIMGLIVQVNQPYSFDNTLVLVEAPKHEPRLTVPMSAVINADDPWVRQNQQGSNLVIDLTGATVRIEGTRGVFSNLTTDFMDASPRMATIAPGCRLRPEVRRREILKDNITAYVDFRGGKVEPDHYLENMLSFSKDGLSKPRCAVCRVLYSADLHGDHVTFVYKKKTETHKVLVRGGRKDDVPNVPRITITNTPPSGGESSHFLNEFNIYVDKCFDKRFSPKKMEACTKPNCLPVEQINGIDLKSPGYDCTVGQQP